MQTGVTRAPLGEKKAEMPDKYENGGAPLSPHPATLELSRGSNKPFSISLTQSPSSLRQPGTLSKK